VGGWLGWLISQQAVSQSVSQPASQSVSQPGSKLVG